jgi:anti-anti-sigma factor
MALADNATLRLHERMWSFMIEQTMQEIVDTESVGEILIVTLGERMDAFSAPLLIEEFDELLDEGTLHFIVDLSAVRIVDADGDYPLLHLLKRAQATGGNVVLVCPPGNPIRIFYEMMHLDTLFDLVNTLENAMSVMQMHLDE